MNDNGFFLGLSPHADTAKTLSNRNLELLADTVSEILRKVELSPFQEVILHTELDTKELVDYLNRSILHTKIKYDEVSHKLTLDLTEEDINALHRFEKAIEKERQERVLNDLSLLPHIKNKNIPANWELIEDEEKDKAYLKHNEKVVFEFKHMWANRYKYFKALWDNYGKKVEYKVLFEYEGKLKYPEKGVAKTNSDVRNTINKLKKEIDALPLEIKTAKGFTLSIIE